MAALGKQQGIYFGQTRRLRKHHTFRLIHINQVIGTIMEMSYLPWSPMVVQRQS